MYSHSKQTNYCDFSIEEAELMVSTTNIAEEEYCKLDYPLTKINFNDILKEIMAKDSTSWEALAFVRQCKKIMPGFGVNVCLGESYSPK